jgi:hypothetical protein
MTFYEPNDDIEDTGAEIEEFIDPRPAELDEPNLKRPPWADPREDDC